MMKATWVLALAAGATLSVSVPDDALAQGRSAVARQRQEQQQEERQRERERVREQREDAREQRDARPSPVRLGPAERERLRQEQERRDREAAEARRRELERQRLREQRDGRYDDRYYDDRYDRRGDRWDDGYDRDGQRKGPGPAFCRSGQGHPVHGREWCRRKGFGLGRDRWERTRWDDIIFRDDRRRDRVMGRSVLGDILGIPMLSRFESYGRRYSRDPLVGYWVPEGRAQTLVLSVGDFPIARLIDLNRDGRVDNVYLWR